MQSLELKIPPLLLACVFAAAMVGLAQVAPALTFSLPLTRIASRAIALLGAAFAVAGLTAFSKHRTTVNPLTPGEASSLVSTGVYRLSRNPMYLGLLLALAGLALHLANAAAALLVPAFVGYMNRFQILPEERALLSKFGPSFAAYTACVRRWV